MKAIQMRAIHMDGLIGRKINTEEIGDYPGGVAEVIQLLPDPNAPEIVFLVRHPSFGEIGIFEYEEVSFA